MDEPRRIPPEWPQAEALFRMQLVMPLLDPLSSPAERAAWRQQVLSRRHTLPDGRTRTLSARTLRRWVQQARQVGLEGLERRSRNDRHTGRKVTPAMVERARQLKEEEPRRSIPHIVRIMEHERGAPLPVTPGALWRHLRRLGLSARKRAPKEGLRSFEAARTGDLWQSDVKHGPYLPDPNAPERMRRVYLITFLDDYSRYCCHSEWFGAEDLFALEIAFQKALLRRGKPHRVYVDLALIYQSPVFIRACAKLGIRHIPGTASHPQGRGKLERFHKTLEDEFLLELSREPVTSLQALNERYWAWLEEVYHMRVHSQTKQSPLARWLAGDPQRPVDPALVAELFLWELHRTVDKTGCIKFFGRLYQCVPGLEGRKVLVRYHPHRLQALQLWIGEQRYPDAVPLDLHTPKERVRSPQPAAPPAAVLERLVHQHAQHKRAVLSSLRLASLKEDGPDV